MNICGYINFNHLFDTETNCVNALKEWNCSTIYSDKIDDFSGQGWKSFVYGLHKGDTAVFVSLNSVFADILHFVFFFKLCKRNGIRIVSVEDGIDTCNTDMLKSLSAMAVIRVRPGNPGNAEPVREAETMLVPHDVLTNRKHVTVLNMYNADYDIGMIMDVTGYKSKFPIYQILNRYNVKRKHLNKIRSRKGCDMQSH